MKVMVAMSGGVDSSVAAALLKDSGHEVIGVTMQLWPRTKDSESAKGTCCGREAIDDARRVAHRLGIPHYVFDFRDVFTRTVIEDFCREYGRGRTPNPCVLCNNLVKFGALWEKAKVLDAEYIATGHYARVESGRGEHVLKKGVDPIKDQSYFLCRLTTEQLGLAMFPVGHLTKQEVRHIAAEKGLPVAGRRESQEICFIPGDDHAAFIREYSAAEAGPGPIVDGEGHTLGRHMGITSYTIGQRRGLGIAAPDPLYVTDIVPEENTIAVGTKEGVYGSELVAGDLNWIALDRPMHPIEVSAKIRYRHPEAAARVVPLDDGTVYVKFSEPQMAITPGQTIAFYDGDTVVGGGTILRQGRNHDQGNRSMPE